MTSKLKCPFCGEELAKDENLDGGDYVPYFCENDKCMKSFLFYGTKELWQELIRTRKALDVAVDALKEIDWCAQDYAKAQEALNKITALEQKDKR